MKLHQTFLVALALVLSVKAYGQTELIKNPYFDTSLSEWTSSGNIGWSNSWLNISVNNIFSGSAVFNGGETLPNGVLTQDFFPTSGQLLTLKIEYFKTGRNLKSAGILVEVIDKVSSNIAYSHLFSVAPTLVFKDSVATFLATSDYFQVRCTDKTSDTRDNDFNLSTLSIMQNDTIQPPIKPKFFIPNAFTPDGDGANDLFAATVEKITVAEFKIYARWGSLIFDNPTGKWDGTYNSVPMPPDVYFYKILLKYPDGKLELKKGDVTLIR